MHTETLAAEIAASDVVGDFIEVGRDEGSEKQLRQLLDGARVVVSIPNAAEVDHYIGCFGDAAWLRINTRTYDDTTNCLEALYQRVRQGGIIIVDNYDECADALEDFFDAYWWQQPELVETGGSAYFHKVTR